MTALDIIVLFLLGSGAVFGFLRGFVQEALSMIAWVLIKVPDYPGQTSEQRLLLRRVLVTPGVRSVLGVVVTWMLAHNILYTYIAPFVSQAGLTGNVDVVLLVFGVAALMGIWITGRLVDRHLRNTVLASLATFAVVSVLFGVALALAAGLIALLKRTLLGKAVRACLLRASETGALKRRDADEPGKVHGTVARVPSGRANDCCSGKSPTSGS